VIAYRFCDEDDEASESIYTDFAQFLQVNVGTMVRIGRDRFLPNPFQFIIYQLHYDSGSRDSSVGIATGYRLDDGGVGVQVLVEARIFSSPCRPGRFWGPPSLLTNGHRGVKRPRSEADHSPPTSAEIRKTWSYTSTLQYAFIA
jgi:hypothetical protein